MPLIYLETLVHAPAVVCFDLSRDVDVHMASTNLTGERAVAGVQSGMMALNDTVTWEATHFGVRQRLTSRITAFERPQMFIDEMQRGAFRHWRHLHRFTPLRNGTLMIDEVDFASPLGWLGWVVDTLLLKAYMTRLLIKRNSHIKHVAEARPQSH